jgi:deazaflavin-dependent oxidoreductase (nitroreductase family)
VARKYRFSSAARFINWLFRVMTRLGLGASYRYILTVRGRKTGRRYTIPVDVMELGSHKWLVAPYGVSNWVHNVRATGEVTLTRGGRSETFKVQEATAPEAVPVLRKYLVEVPVTRPYFDAAPDSPDGEIAAELPKHPAFRLVPVE